MRRRDWLAGSVASVALGACGRGDVGGERDASVGFEGGWIGASHDRGHLLRDGMHDGLPSDSREPKSGALPTPAMQRRATVLIVGAGIAGLAAARALQAAGIDDVRLFDLEDHAGGNSRGHAMAGRACPLGAHYLPLPGPAAHEVGELLASLGLSRSEHGRTVYDERYLCHSPQERLFIDGAWQDGLLPAAHTPELLAKYRAFARAVDMASRETAFAMPTSQAAWTPAHDRLDATTFAQWLDARGFDQPRLRWYLDYCCRDDYGASAAQVSAWAGVHYFASRHGFRAPGEDGERDAVLTWPEGNAWLAERLAAPFRDRTHTGRVALHANENQAGVTLDVWDVKAQAVERWTASRLVLAVPIFIAARLLAVPPSALREAASQMRYAPWLVANLQLAAPLTDRPGAPMSWDNMLYDENPASAALGYVDATHQSLSPIVDGKLITAYWALGGRSAAEALQQRKALLAQPWQTWSQAVIADLSRAHPDLPRKLGRIDLMRYGHAMSIPVPGLRGSAALRALAQPQGRVHFAHGDLSAYSVFEEAYGHGLRAGREAAAALT